jgi:hypothetical protein
VEVAVLLIFCRDISRRTIHIKSSSSHGTASFVFQVPAVMTDRYARLNHGYVDERDCAEYGMGEKPQECLDGSADAQYAVAIESLISNGFTFLTSSLIGSLSDEYGRKGE